MNVIVAFFIMLHAANGQQLYVSTDQITSLRAPIRNDLNHFPPGTRCIVSTTDGKFVAVQELCSAIRQQIDSAN